MLSARARKSKRDVFSRERARGFDFRNLCTYFRVAAPAQRDSGFRATGGSVGLLRCARGRGRGQSRGDVLFSDLVGSTDLLARLGEAAFDQFRRHHLQVLWTAVAEHAGRQIKTTGDGILAPLVAGTRVSTTCTDLARSASGGWPGRSRCARSPGNGRTTWGSWRAVLVLGRCSTSRGG